MRRILHLLILTLFGSASAQSLISIDDFTTRNTFAQKSVYGINWMNDGKYYTSLSDNKIIKYDVTTGLAVATLLDGGKTTPQLDISNYSLSRDEQKILVVTEMESIYRRSYKAEYFIYQLSDNRLTKLSVNGKQSYATFSPDGSFVAFARNNNLFFVNLQSRQEVQVTSDGLPNSIINGSTDWVYEEELSFAQAFYWSPDGKKLAYYRFDESKVKEYNLQKWNQGALYPEDYRYKYPKAGEDNSVVEIWIYDISTQSKTKADLGLEKDIYVPRVTWTQDPSILSIRRLNRLQNTLDFFHTNATTGKSALLLTEKSDTYIDIDFTDELEYLENGKQFIVSSERTGFKHFYLYNMDGTLVRPLTTGDWEVSELVGVDEKAKVVYYTSTEGNYLNRSLYSVSLDGKRKQKLSSLEGTHGINLSNDGQFYIDYFSSSDQPLTVSLYKTKGNTLVKVLETNEALKQKLAEYGIVRKEPFRYLSADGVTEVDGFLLKPTTLEAGKKYPLLVYQYSGPRSNSTLNSFGGGATFFWHQMMVQKGIIVAVVDTRGTGSRGSAFTKQTYKQLGKMELEDLLAAGKYLGSLEYVDKDRLAIWGWSYGGYTTSLTMTKGAGTYKVGIAGAPVTTWRYYDNIYTERFLQRPQDNPSGYDDNSPLNFADQLRGSFLLIHGTGDDNVHFQNSVALEDALIRAGKQFRSHFYPDQAHGFRGAKVNKHRWELMTEFLHDNL